MSHKFKICNNFGYQGISIDKTDKTESFSHFSNTKVEIGAREDSKRSVCETYLKDRK
jgi:hypothetical protein